MARGRMLNRKISLSKQVAELINDLGHSAGIVYTWMIAHLDCEGRISGDPEVIRWTVCPMIKDISVDFVNSVLDRSHELKLLTRYEKDGDLFVEFEKFSHNQVGLRKEREQSSEIPPRNTAESSEKKGTEKVAYFVRGESTGLIKIGESRDPVSRLAQLQNGASEKLELLAVGGNEKDLHKRLEKYRIFGEWFRPSEEVMDAVRTSSGLAPDQLRTGPTTDRTNYGPDLAGLREEKRREEKRREENYIARSAKAPSEQKPASPKKIIFTLPTTKDDYQITADDIAEWREAYPAVDVQQALRSMRQWCISNPSKKKTYRGIRRFITSWLDREQNKGGNSPKSGSEYQVVQQREQRQKRAEVTRRKIEESERIPVEAIEKVLGGKKISEIVEDVEETSDPRPKTQRNASVGDFKQSDHETVTSCQIEEEDDG